ncbi:hypothetical protein NDU88_006586 [Pleurodeles waltl]|uniref:Uncharacterized protein n=1 Tax=Pleurodeles waltl TaxID=8319 RepID=A0AAV7MEG1_PLEWA|nr:hypothetical protein NDU88_006586 [Pleurodeles waltl]
MAGGREESGCLPGPLAGGGGSAGDPIGGRVGPCPPTTPAASAPEPWVDLGVVWLGWLGGHEERSGFLERLLWLQSWGLRGWVAYVVGCWLDWRLRLEPLVRRGGSGPVEGDCAG